MDIENNYIKETFIKLAPKKVRVVNCFYTKLFDEAPELRALFAKTDPKTQKEMLMGAISLVVKASKDNFHDMSYFVNLGERHAKYSFSTRYFNTFNKCLLSTIAEFFGSLWNAEMEEQWLYALQKVTEAMVSGMTSGHTRDAIHIRGEDFTIDLLSQD